MKCSENVAKKRTGRVPDKAYFRNLFPNSHKQFSTLARVAVKVVVIVRERDTPSYIHLARENEMFLFTKTPRSRNIYCRNHINGKTARSHRNFQHFSTRRRPNESSRLCRVVKGDRNETRTGDNFNSGSVT